MPRIGAASVASALTAPIPALELGPLFSFGHSYVKGGAGGVDGERFVDKFARRIGAFTHSNFGGAGQTLAQILSGQVQPRSTNILGTGILCGIINDINASVSTATSTEAFRSILAYLTSRAKLAYNDTAFSYGSGWTTGTTSTANSTVDFAWVGDSAYLLIENVTSTGGTATITASGTHATVATVSTGSYGYAFTGAVKLSGFGAGNHTVRLTVNSGTITVTGAAIPSPTPMTVLWVQEGAITSYSGAQNTDLTVTRPTAMRAILTDFPTVVEVQPDASYDNTTMLHSDNTHPNDKGHAYYADRMMTAASALAFRQGQNNVTVQGLSAATYTGTTPSYV